MSLELLPYKDTWPADDPHANFKAEVACYTQADPLPTLEGLSAATGIPISCLARYVLVKWAASAGDALLAMGPIALEQMRRHVEAAEAAGTDAARLEAYTALSQMIAWLTAAEQEPPAGAP
ncbi:MAG TPA: DUF6027 family protein [Chthonomonadaceae bacterium]|nr:DUF6027 family protein [Chthonomonadaceae bacterium]